MLNILFETALIVAIFTFIGCVIQFIINPLLNNYLEQNKEKPQINETFD